MDAWDKPLTLFLSNLAPCLPDSFVKNILQQCGTVQRWQRAMTAKDELSDFGFVEYKYFSDAIRALRIIPNITVLHKKWNLIADRECEYDIFVYQNSLRSRGSFDEEKDKRKDRMCLQMINDYISTSGFQQTVPRLETLIQSENDEARENEHFKYQKEIRLEDEEYDRKFRDKLIEWKKIEIQTQRGINTMKKLEESDAERNIRQQKLRKWKSPTDPESEEEFNDYLKLRKARQNIRGTEILLDQLSNV